MDLNARLLVFVGIVILAPLALQGCDQVSALKRLFHSGSMIPRKETDAVSPAVKDPDQHLRLLQVIKKHDLDVLFLGDSLVSFWQTQGPVSWEKLAPYKPANLGVAGDRTEHLLWRITNGELSNIEPKLVVILIGTNNIGQCGDERPEWVAKGIEKIVATVHAYLPSSRVLLLAIFPRNGRGSRERKIVSLVNAQIQTLGNGNDTLFLDIGPHFLNSDGNIPPDVMADQLHLTAKGYEIWLQNMKPLLDTILP